MASALGLAVLPTTTHWGLSKHGRIQIVKSSAAEPRPYIDVTVMGPTDGEQPCKTSVPSGEKLLRNVILDNKLELYGLYGKLMNCGGCGSCGTCTVEILEGQELLNDRTEAEDRFLKNKPKNWRLSCQTIVGDKTKSGKVTVQRLPQYKKTV